MRINTNIVSLLAQTQLQRSSNALERTLERLSSGLRINSARDDASGLAQAVGLDSEMRGLSRGVLNMNEARAVLMTADGTLQTQMDLTQRMRELALQAANGPLSSNDRFNLNQEFQGLLAEFDRVAQSATWIDKSPLLGDYSDFKIQLSGRKSDVLSLSLETSLARGTFTYSSTSSIGSEIFTASSLSTANTPQQVASADFNKDGHIDLISVNSGSNNLSLRLGDGLGAFSAGATLSVSAATRVAVGDWNKDGNEDLLIAAGTNVAVRLGDGTGNFTVGSTINNTTGVGELRLADIDGDGNLDLSTNTWPAATQIFWGDGAGAVSAVATYNYAQGGAEHLTEWVDVDGDSDLDMVSSTYTSGAAVFIKKNLGSRNFGAHTALSAPGGGAWTYFAPGDFDGDGDQDLAGVAFASGNVQMFFNDGSGGFTQGATLSTTTWATRLQSADLNHDGLDDLYAGNNISAGTNVWFARGSGAFSSIQTLSQSSTSNWAHAVDVNGDGILDIVSPNSGSSGLSVYTQGVEVKTTVNSIRTGFDLLTRESAEKALAFLEGGIDRLISRRASIGASVNRLDHAQLLNEITRENISRARSEIMDADMVAEVVELNRLQILQRAQASVLAQANVGLQKVLQLLSR